MLIVEAMSRPCDLHTKRRYYDAVKAARFQMHPFVFDDKASEIVGRFCMECPDLIIQHRQFAVPPYPVTYVELSRPFFDQMADTGLPEPDTAIGYLFFGNRVAVFVRTEHFAPQLMPLSYVLLPPGQTVTPHWAIGKVNIDADIVLAASLGTALFNVDDEDTRMDIARSVDFQHEGMYQPRPNDIAGLLYNLSGDVRNMWAALLWLNIPSKYVSRSPVAARRTFHRGRPLNYAAHNIVKIELGRTRKLRAAFMLNAPRLPPRRHEVRGNWHHKDGQLAGCTHVWPLLPDHEHVYVCASCGRRRWWVKSHQRGDITKGFVTKDYQVQP